MPPIVLPQPDSDQHFTPILKLTEHNPFRDPDWRWQRIQRFCERPIYAPRLRFETPLTVGWVNRGKKFLEELRAGLKSEREHWDFLGRWPDIYWAHQIREGVPSPTLATAVEARLLAGQSCEDIAALLGCEPRVIAAYEALFFAVSDRLHHPHYIYRVVLQLDPTRPIRESDCRTLCRLLGYIGGPLVLNVVFEYSSRAGRHTAGQTVAQRLAEITDENILRQALLAALTMDCNADTQPATLALFARLRDRQREPTDAGYKYAAAVQAALRLLQVRVVSPDGPPPRTAAHEIDGLELRFEEYLAKYTAEPPLSAETNR